MSLPQAALTEGVIIPVVYMPKGHPHCVKHGAMNVVAPGLFRCLECHIGYDTKPKPTGDESVEGKKS